MTDTLAPCVREPIQPKEAIILIVEDSLSDFVLMARMLAYLGIPRCEWKTSGWQLIEFGDSLPRIALILMNIRLPYEDSYTALAEIRATRRFKDTIVVAITAEASQEQMDTARAAGFDGYLGNPLNPDTFPDQIRRMLVGELVWEL